MNSGTSPHRRPDLHRRLSPWRERAVLSVAALGAGALVLLAVVGFGDPEARVRATYEREGEALGVVVDLEWSALLAEDSLPGLWGSALECASAPAEFLEAAGPRTRAEPRPVDPAKRAAVEDALGTAEALAYRPDGRQGARNLISSLMKELGPDSFQATGEAGARLQGWLLRDALGEEDREAYVFHSASLRQVDGSWVEGGVPLGVLAWLARVDHFESESESAEHHELDRQALVDWGTEILGAWLAGELTLPDEGLRLRSPKDLGLALEIAPPRAALERALDRAFIELGVRSWTPSGVLGAERALRFVESEWGLRLDGFAPGRWAAVRGPGGWLGVRRTGGLGEDRGSWRVVRLDLDALGEALGQRLARRETWPGDARLEWLGTAPDGPGEGDRVLGDGGPWVRLVRGDLEGALAAERRRIGLFRGGLGLLAVGILLFGLSTFRTLRRGRALQEQKSRFIASVSHELRTPTASILLLAENLEEDRVRDDVGRRRYGGLIRREAVRLRRLVDDVLDVTRLERGSPAPLRIDAVRSASFFADLERDLAETEDGDAKLHWTLGELPPGLRVDGEALRRAIWNLVDNARAHAKAARIEVHAEVVEDRLEVAVRDDGRGIPAASRDAVFEAFVRLDADLEGAPGTGLGLVIVREIARGHGGSVEVTEGLDGRGVGFMLRLPLGGDGPGLRGFGEEENVA